MAKVSCTSPANLEELAAGRLPPADVEALIQHLESCEHCLARVQTQCPTDTLLSVLNRATRLPDGPEQGVVSHLIDRLEKLGQSRNSTPFPEGRGEETLTLVRSSAAETDDEIPSSASAVEDREAAEEAWDFLAPPRRRDEIGRLGPYRILKVLGQGGMSIVFQAEEPSLERLVALKVMPPLFATQPAARQRFLREARAAGALKHDNIVAIYQVGEDRGAPYLAMELLEGESLDTRLKRDPLPLADVLRIGRQVAEGLDAAHERGLVHRDIKPANIWLETPGRVKLLDFGLARTTDDPGHLTRTGDVVGTPAFMAPEQAAGEAVDHRCDLFSLGAVLYRMCTGVEPFRGTDTWSALMALATQDPSPPHVVNAGIPRAFSDLVMKLLVKDPAQRTGSAREVARALASLEESLPDLISAARAQPRRPRFLRRVARPQVLVGAGLLLLLAATAAYLLPAIVTRLGTEPVRIAPAALDSPLDHRNRQDVPPVLLRLVGNGDPEKAPPELVAVLGDDRFVVPRDGLMGWLAQSADGKLLAVPSGPEVHLLDAASGRYLRSLPTFPRESYAADFSPDGKRLAVTPAEREAKAMVTIAKVLDTETGAELLSLRGHTGRVVRAVFSPQGDRIATVSYDRTVRVWDAANGQELHTLHGHAAATMSVILSSDGKRIISGGGDGTIRIWDADSGDEIKTLAGHQGAVFALAFSPDNMFLASGSDRDWKLWDAATFDEILSRDAPADWLAFSASGKELLTAPHLDRQKAHVVTRWNTATGKEIGRMPMSSRGFYHVYHLGTDQKTLFSGSVFAGEHRLEVYDAADGKELLPRPGHGGGVRALAVSPDGRTLASGGMDRSVRLWDLGKSTLIRSLDKHKGPVCSLAFSPGGKLLASGSLDGTIILWDLAGSQDPRILTGHSTRLSRIAFSPDGRIVAAGGENGSVQQWNVASGEAREPFHAHTQAVHAVAFSPDGKLMASGGADRQIHVTAAEGGPPIHTFATEGVVANLAFSLDGQALAAVGNAPRASVQLWDIASQKKIALAGHTDLVAGLDFHPGGGLMATGSDDGTMRLWDGSTGREVQTLRLGPTGTKIHQVAFTPEGRYVAAAQSNGMVCILRLPR